MKPLLVAVVGLFVIVPPTSAEESCVEVEIGGEVTPGLNCLNQKLRRRVEETRPVENVAPLDAMSSPPVKLGGYNETALKQQYGPNYGKSAIPWRPTNTYGGARR